MIKNEELINKFCSYFDGEIKEIENLNNRLYQKILIVILWIHYLGHGREAANREIN